MLAKVASYGLVLGASAFFALMWGLLIREHVVRPGFSQLLPDYSRLLPAGVAERSERWGIFMNDVRIGRSAMHVSREADGTIALTTSATLSLGPALKYVAGIEGPLDVEFRALLSPLRGMRSFHVESEALDVSIQGLVGKDQMMLSGRAGGRRIKTRMPHEPGVGIAEALSPMAAAPALDVRQVGRDWQMSLLNPITGQMQPMTVRVARALDVRYEGETATLFQLAFTSGSNRWTSWVTDKGEVLVQGTPFGLTLRREDIPDGLIEALRNAEETLEESP